MLNELAIIDALKQAFPEQIGDDAAVIPVSPTNAWVLSKDLLVESTHFRRHYYSPQDLAYKALHVNLSDMAAMGAVPKLVMLGLAVPRDYEAELDAFLQTFSAACLEAQVQLIGGDTTASESQLMISVTVIGDAHPDAIKYRHLATPGDVICVAGALGYAHVGLLALEQSLDGFDSFKQASTNPKALVAEGQWLGQQACVTAMMDVSDGLRLDLAKLCKASDCGALVDLAQIELSDTFKVACQQFGLMPQDVMAVGGEDYALLFTVQAEQFSTLSAAFAEKFGYSLTVIGQMQAGQDVTWQYQGKAYEMTLKPYSHF